jgi:hypothetical protein
MTRTKKYSGGVYGNNKFNNTLKQAVSKRKAKLRKANEEANERASEAFAPFKPSAEVSHNEAHKAAMEHNKEMGHNKPIIKIPPPPPPLVNQQSTNAPMTKPVPKPRNLSKHRMTKPVPKPRNLSKHPMTKPVPKPRILSKHQMEINQGNKPFINFPPPPPLPRPLPKNTPSRPTKVAMMPPKRDVKERPLPRPLPKNTPSRPTKVAMMPPKRDVKERPLPRPLPKNTPLVEDKQSNTKLQNTKKSTVRRTLKNLFTSKSKSKKT